MCEFKRVFCSRTFITSLILLLLVNVGFYAYNSAGGSEVPLATDEYVSKYNGYYDKIESEASRLKKLSIFSDKDSFSYKNIIKTAKDFEKIKDWEIEQGDFSAEESLFSDNTLDYLPVIFIVMLCTIFLQERKGGMWQIVHASYKGRTSLAIKRIIILLLSSAIVITAMFGTRMLLAGKIQFEAPVQSIPRFQFIPESMTFGSFIFEFVGVRIMSLFLAGLVLWLLLSISKNISVAAFITSVVLASQYALFIFIRDNSILVLLRYINIFSFIEIQRIYEKYLNLNIFGAPVNAKALILFLLPFLIIIFAGVDIIYAAGKRPVSQMSFLERGSDKVKSWISPVFGKLGLFAIEGYKVLFSLKGIFIILAFVWVLSDYSGITIPEMGMDDFYALSYYEEYKGEVTPEKIGQLEAEKEEVIRQAQENSAADMGEHYANRIAAANKVLREARRIYEINISQGKELELVEPYVYLSLFSVESSGYHRKRGAELSLFIVLLLAGLFAYENQNGVKQLVLSTGRGRTILVRTKILQGVMFVSVLFVFFYGVEIISVQQTFGGLSCLRAPARSLEFLRSLPEWMSLAHLLVMSYASKFLAAILLFLLLSVISCIFRKVNDAVIAGTIFLIFPSTMVILGLESMGKFTLIHPFDPEIIQNADFLFWIPALMILLFPVNLFVKWMYLRKTA